MPTENRNAAKGRFGGADKAGHLLPDAAHSRNGTGRSLVAGKADGKMPAPVSPKAAKGLSPGAGTAARMMPDDAQNDGAGHCPFADKAGRAVPDPSPKSREGQDNRAYKARPDVPVSASLDQLAELQVRRKFYIGAVNKQTNAVKALVRRALGWRYDEEEGDREKVNGRAARIVAAALNGKEQKPEDAETFGALAADLSVVAAAIEPCMNARHQIELDMKRAVRKLPVFEWAKSVHGLGELGLAVILAEAGDLSKYPKKGHLWKRLGLAPLDGQAYSTWRMKGGLTAEDWTEAGYSPRRRAEVFAVVSEPLFRAQTVAQGPYRAIYDARRARTAEVHPDWTKAHSHMDGLRIMTKYLLRDLWREWNRRKALDFLPVMAFGLVPTGGTNEQQLAA